MGGCTITLTAKGHLTNKEIVEMVDRQRIEDREYNGHQEGYSGDWQTVHDIDIRGDLVFNSYAEAEEWCNNNVEKWSGAAVKYKKQSVLASAKLDKLEIKLKEEYQKLATLKEDIKTKFRSRKSKFVGCPECKSSLNLSKFRDTSCLVCGADLRSKTDLNRIARQEKAIDTASDKVSKLEKELREKNVKKATVRWLVYGAAAC
jgi:hypothetical protein